MSEYHKIQTVFKRDPATKMRTLLEGEYSEPEFAYLENNLWVWTEKVDGTNIRVMVGADGFVTFGGRTDAAQIPAKLVDRLNQLFLTVEKRALLRASFPEGACLYGEGHGAGIQKVGKHYGPEQDFVLFDVRVGKWWLKPNAVMEVAATLELCRVPTVGEGTLPEMVEFVRGGFKSVWGDFPAEGVVARPALELLTRGGDRIITKLKQKDFGGGK